MSDMKCPVCGGEKKNKKAVTCGYSCSNTLFRSGPNNPNWKESNYRSTCFYHHEKKCLVCGFDYIVVAHHVDEDKSNNSPENLVPLCPNHHEMIHSSHRDLVQPDVDKYLAEKFGD